MKWIYFTVHLFLEIYKEMGSDEEE
jgi:hypothetical protein